MSRPASLASSEPRQTLCHQFVIRAATKDEAPEIHALIAAHLEEGHMLPRELDEVAAHAERFVVAIDEDGLVAACGELAPLSRTLAEVRSFVVSSRHRRSGLGRRMVAELRRRAHLQEFDALCAFTHSPEYFVHLDFSIVPHTWLPEKISADCGSCSLFRRCGQYAMLVDVEPSHRPATSPAALHA
jgi:N-acetylglutamate synthase-like GNAT family acetyltransferase